MTDERYWARDRSDLPLYGPTDPFGDEEHTPDVVVRVDFLMSREQITTALGIAWAETAGDRNPESLTVLEVRHEVEAYLSVQAFHALGVQMESDQQRTFPPKQQAVMQLLAEAVAKAYPPRRTRERLVQNPRYGEGTVTLQTTDRGEITITEPAWCAGHEGDLVGTLAEISHDGHAITSTVDTPLQGPETFMQAQITHAPYLEQQPEPHPLVYVEAMAAASFDGPALRTATAKLRDFLTRVDHLAHQIDELTEGGERP